MWQLQEESQTVFSLCWLKNSFLLILKNMGLTKSLIDARYFAGKINEILTFNLKDS